MELKNMISESEKVQVFECGDKCVKVFKDPNEPKSVVLYEALTHTRVEETGFARIPAFEEIIKVDGKWAIVYKHIKGKTMKQLMDENPKKVDDYLAQMVDLQIEINNLRSAKISKLKDYLKRSIESLDMIDDVKKYELLTRLEAMPKHVKLCHGDFNPSNIIVGDDGKLYVIDWVHASQGNASADVARTYLLLSLKDKKKAELYMDLFCEKTGTEKRYVQGWLPIVAAAQLAYKRPEEKDLLESWINVFEYQ